MTARPIPETWWKPVTIAIALFILLVAAVLAVGCTLTPLPGNLIPSPTQTLITPAKEKSELFYHVTIPQPEGIYPDYIKMDSDVYIQGEVIEFQIVNDGSGSLACWQSTPSNNFHLYRQIGTWEKQPEPEMGGHTDSGYYLQPGESTILRHLNTADLPPGHYKIITECGVSREFEIRAAPGATQ